jgi:pSer/pThr/pTyr-binding forkhead associated (FHA) protein
MAVIIEVLGWGGKRRKYFKVDADQVSIGRGYDNDIVLSDPHISANHLRLNACGEGWSITDLDSLNGLQVIKNPSTDERIFTSGAEIKLGRTKLRLVSESHPLEDTKMLHRLERDTSKLNRLSVWLPLLVMVFVTQLTSVYTSTLAEWEWKNTIPVIISAQLVIFIGAIFWSLVGRLVRQEAHFLGQYSLILLASLLFTGCGWLLSTLSYNFSSVLFGDMAQQLVSMSILFLLLSANLALATNLSSRARWSGCAAFVGVILIIGSIGQMKSWGEFSPFPQYSSTLSAPPLLVVKGQTTEQFLADIVPLFQLADKAALEK